MSRKKWTEKNIYKTFVWHRTTIKNILQNTYNSAIKKQPIKQMGKRLGKKHFTIEDIQTAKKHMESCSTSWVKRQIQIKGTIKYHYNYTLSWIAKTKQNNKIPNTHIQLVTLNTGRHVEKLEK